MELRVVWQMWQLLTVLFIPYQTYYWARLTNKNILYKNVKCKQNKIYFYFQTFFSLNWIPLKGLESLLQTLIVKSLYPCNPMSWALGISNLNSGKSKSLSFKYLHRQVAKILGFESFYYKFLLFRKLRRMSLTFWNPWMDRIKSEDTD